MHFIYKTTLFILLLFFHVLSFSQIAIVKDGKAISRIVVDMNNENDLFAAKLLCDFTKKISNAELKIISAKERILKGDIIIGNVHLPINMSTSEIKEDGFILASDKQNIYITGDQGKGAIYGVITLLENYFEVYYLAENTCSFTPRKNMQFPINTYILDNPSFRYRQTQAYSLKDPLYKIWHRLEEPSEMFAENLWVHTFNHLLPAAKYGTEHPEYYSFINEKRRPGTASQWCLTNPEVFEIVSQRIDSIFKVNPDKKMISVSQNDSQTHCYCDECKKIDDYEGSPSGSLIYFMNKLAQRFPNKEFSTLAYLYSVAPPKHIKPLPNVNIMLCDIDCYREVTLTENKSGQTFVKDMEGWSNITNNIFVWDYGINFDNYISPFPNFHILQPNMQLFKKNNASMHFSQIGGSKGGDFSELRSYVVAKLLWNVDTDVEATIKIFLEKYYGNNAAPYLYRYLKMREGALIGSNIPLWIYDTPITHKNGMLNHAMLLRYNELFDLAEVAAEKEKNNIFKERVQIARLPIQYAELEILRTEAGINKELLRRKLDIFRNRAKEYNIETLNERNNRIEEYCDLYTKRNLFDEKKNLAYGAKITYITPPNAPYDKIADHALTDGLYGGATFNEGWVGWLEKDANLIVDLGEIKEIHHVELDFLHKLGAWILLPKDMDCYTSIDNKEYIHMGHVSIDEDRDIEVKYVNIGIKSDQSIKARYIKIKVGTIGLCPPWHYGVGNPAWFFFDEINVY